MLGHGVLGGRPGACNGGEEFSEVTNASFQRLPSLGTFQPQVALFYMQRRVTAMLARSTTQSSRSNIVMVFTLCTAGFIDFIVEPTFSVLTDVAEKSVQPLVDEDSKSKNQPR